MMSNKHTSAKSDANLDRGTSSEMTKEPAITVTSPLLPNLQEFTGMLEEIWQRKWITNNGDFHQQLEK